VNIIDLIEWGRKQDVGAKRVRVFASMKTLKKYSVSSNKIFSNDLDESCVLRHLLRRFFSVGTIQRLALVGP
jgi:hypothetical protein